ncbi:exopolysaccharide production repressor protein [Aliirhizobium terrae]|uniref:exopolysaccharide production repressor protein n=1 Tax=Terrirhizobium terrae TaxID=2926709 RepID=UPI0025761FA0|nr:exopolysaccharide production repressor protein [Rhizobium sp. CC-CFT758]WJH41037.1 exopolysaccharide production repressor protein [Rhizobium sp. CC-CFT758]
MMYAPRVFVSMMAVLIVFAVAAYLTTGSLLTALGQTLLCAIILQVGYFVGVLYLVHREKSGAGKDRNPDVHSSRQIKEDLGRDEIRADAAARVRIHDR